MPTLRANAELGNGVETPTEHVERTDRTVGTHARSIARQPQRSVLERVVDRESDEDRPGRLAILFFGSGDADVYKRQT